MSSDAGAGKPAQKRGSDVWIAELRFRRVVEATEELRSELDRYGDWELKWYLCWACHAWVPDPSLQDTFRAHGALQDCGNEALASHCSNTE
jgi:hypothetical protein